MDLSFEDEKPIDGQRIQAKFPDGEWYDVTYYDAGIDGLLEDNNDGLETELEEYREITWRLPKGG